MVESLLATSDNQKLRGGYYTPEAIARFMVGWAARRSTDEILEPSCGDGMFLDAAAERLLALGAAPEQALAQLQGVQLYESEANLTEQRLARRCGVGKPRLFIGDF